MKRSVYPNQILDPLLRSRSVDKKCVPVFSLAGFTLVKMEDVADVLQVLPGSSPSSDSSSGSN